MEPFRLYAATDDAVARLDSRDREALDVFLNLEGRSVIRCTVPAEPP